jgi:hypothetical protein
MFANKLSNYTSAKYILYFLLGWTILNALQAATLGLHSDEAYYWVYSQFLDWGYYDHPPMVALFIRLGDNLLPTELGLRMLTVITSSISMYVMWLMARRYQADVRWFTVIMAGIFAFHIYGFNTTPDSPLLFFTVLFYYLYLQYVRRNSFRTALLLGLVVACLLYSKYHAVLLIAFTVFSNLQLFKRRTFYVIPVLAIILYLPHILWQVHHGYPSVAYHLFERSSETYDFAHTYLFFPGQLLMAGPLVGWFLFYYVLGVRVKKDVFIRALVYNAIGIFLFFLLNTIKGNVQPHWTLIGFVPVALLALIRMRQSSQPPQWVYKLALANAGLIIAFRLALIMSVPAVTGLKVLEGYYKNDIWAKQIQQHVGNAYVVMPVGFQSPSKYNYYTHTLKGFAYDEAQYRRTQYDIWPIEDSMQHKRVYYTSPYIAKIATDSIETVTGKWYGVWVDDVRTYQKVELIASNYKLQAKPGQTVTFNLQVSNPYNKAISFFSNDAKRPVVLRACFIQGEELKYMQRAPATFNQMVIAPHQKSPYTFTFKTPLQKGNYDLIFSIRTVPFMGGRNSRIVNFTVQ